MLLLTLITTAFAYPYAPYYQPYILGAPLVGGAPTGATGAKPAGRPTGGMPMGGFGMPFGGIQGFLNMFFPGFSQNPSQLFMMDAAMDGDIAEASKKYMQGDLSEAMDKVYDSGDLMPLMMWGRGAVGGAFGRAAGRSSAGGAAGASGAAGSKTGAAGGASSSSQFPWWLIDLQKPRFERPQTYIQPVVYPNGAVQYFPVTPVNDRLRQMA